MRALPVLFATLAALPFAAQLRAQRSTADSDSAATTSTAPAPMSAKRYRIHLALGFVTSILAHEGGHVAAAYAVGGHPSFGFNHWRPTIYSGIDSRTEPRKQFIFSSAGLTVQTLLDETLLDVPRPPGTVAGPFERGLLAGGIGTVLFYITLGRSASVSDVTFMAKTSSLTKTQVSLIYGGIAALHVVRIHYKDRYAHFFAAPGARGDLRVGMALLPD
jgi:hypothetical protein